MDKKYLIFIVAVFSDLIAADNPPSMFNSRFETNQPQSNPHPHPNIMDGLNNFLNTRNFVNSMTDYNNQNIMGNQIDLEGDRKENRGWMDSARTFINGPGGQMAMQMAKEFISRSGGNQVLSLNLTNLLILVLLKTLVFAAGLIGTGTASHYRSLDNNFLDSQDVELFLGFLTTEGTGLDGCLYKAACNSPIKASEYLKAGRAILQSGFIDSNLSHYTELIHNLELAVNEGHQNANCEMIYSCQI